MQRLGDDTQLLKGVLDGCLLLVIMNAGEAYGYEISTYLTEAGFATVSDGSIYPALLRLQREGHVSATMRQSANGPPRKYYAVTERGQEYLGQFIATWQHFDASINNLIGS